VVFLPPRPTNRSLYTSMEIVSGALVAQEPSSQIFPDFSKQKGDRIAVVFLKRPPCCAGQHASVNVFSRHSTFGARSDCRTENSGRASTIAN